MKHFIFGYIRLLLFSFTLLLLSGLAYKVYATAVVVNLSSAIVGAVSDSGPEFIAADSSGNVYISGTGSGNVQKFSGQGQLLLTIGSSGSGDGQFGAPMGIAVDSSGNIFVADKNLNRMQKFDSSGNFVAKWGSAGSGDGQFASGGSMGGVAVDSSGNVYVVDSYNDRVQKFDNDGNFITKWGTNGSGNSNFYFYAPSDIAIDQSGNVYIADSGNHRIKKYTQNGVFVSAFGSNGTGEGQFDNPVGLAVDSSGKIYVADYNNSRIQVFDSSYNFVEQWGSYGSGSGQFENTVDVLYGPINNLLYVLDYGARIQFFDLGSYTPGDSSPSPTPSPSLSSTTSTNTGSGGSNSSSNAECYALPPITAPEIFRSERVNNGSFDSVTLSFTPVNDRANGYKVMYGTRASADEYGVTFAHAPAAGSLSYEIDYLSPFQAYTFRIQAANDCVTGPWSNYVTASVIAPSIDPTNNNPIDRKASSEVGEASDNKEIIKSAVNQVEPGNRPIDRLSSVLSGDVMPDPAKASNSLINITLATLGLSVLISSILTLITIIKGLWSVYGQIGRNLWWFPYDLMSAIVQKMREVFGSMGFLVFGLSHEGKEVDRGIVFDSTTTTPIRGAFVVLYSKSGNLKSCFSDHNGVYSLMPVPDDYQLKAETNDYQFPSSFVTSVGERVLTPIYRVGEVIRVKSQGEIVDGYAIPMDPVGSMKLFLKMFVGLKKGLFSLITPLLFMLLISTALASYQNMGVSYLILFGSIGGYLLLSGIIKLSN